MRLFVIISVIVISFFVNSITATEHFPGLIKELKEARDLIAKKVGPAHITHINNLIKELERSNGLESGLRFQGNAYEELKNLRDEGALYKHLSNQREQEVRRLTINNPQRTKIVQGIEELHEKLAYTQGKIDVLEIRLEGGQGTQRIQQQLSVNNSSLQKSVDVILDRADEIRPKPYPAQQKPAPHTQSTKQPRVSSLRERMQQGQLTRRGSIMAPTAAQKSDGLKRGLNLNRMQEQAFRDAADIALDTAAGKSGAWAEQMDPRLMLLEEDELRALLNNLSKNPSAQSLVQQRINTLELFGPPPSQRFGEAPASEGPSGSWLRRMRKTPESLKLDGIIAQEKEISIGTPPKKVIPSESAPKPSITQKITPQETPLPKPLSGYFKRLGINLIKGGVVSWGVAVLEADHTQRATEGSQAKIKEMERRKDEARRKGYLHYTIHVPITIGDGTFLGRNKTIHRYDEGELKQFLEDTGIEYNPHYNENDFRRLYTIHYNYNLPDGEFRVMP